MRRLIAVVAIALSMTFVAACEPDDGTGATPDLGSPPGVEPGAGSPAPDPAIESPGLESPDAEMSPAAS